MSFADRHPYRLFIDGEHERSLTNFDLAKSDAAYFRFEPITERLRARRIEWNGMVVWIDGKDASERESSEPEHPMVLKGETNGND